MPTTREMDRQADAVRGMYEELILNTNERFARAVPGANCIDSEQVKALAMAVCEMIYDLKEEMERNFEPKKHDDY